jgi:exonuclease-1
MGVTGLFPAIKPARQQRNIFERGGGCRGKWIGVDSNVWLHMMAHNHAADLVVRKDSTGLVKDFLRRAFKLAENGITPVFVFDGAAAPAKGGTHDARASLREEAVEHFNSTRYGDDEAKDARLLRLAIHITWDVVVQVIVALRANGFSYVVAPYEADSQLIALQQNGGVVQVDPRLTLHVDPAG